MAELSESLGLDLADTLTGYVELLANLFKGAGASIFNTEAQAQNLLFSGSKSAENLLKLFAQEGEGCSLGGLGSVLVGNEVAKMAVFFLTDRSF